MVVTQFGKKKLTVIHQTAILLLIMILAVCCSTKPSNYPRERIPPIVRQIKDIDLHFGEKEIDSGIQLNRGDTVSILAKPQAASPSSTSRQTSPVAQFMVWIGNSFVTSVNSGRTLVTPNSGRLILKIFHGYNDNVASDLTFSIIVWENENFLEITNFLEELNRYTPNHPGIKAALYEAGIRNQVSATQNKTSSEIKNTSEQNQALRLEKESTTTPTVEAAAKENELENRLSELTSKLNHLEELKQQLQSEQEKASLLRQELEEKERRAKELMSRVGGSPKAPPLLVITSPEDGRRNEVDTIQLTGVVEDDHGLMKFEVLVNGQPVAGGETRGIRPVEGSAPKRLSFERRVPLTQGVNRIQVKATDTDGFTADRVLTVHYTISRRNVWAVVVGINDYPQLPKLKYAVNDATEFHRLLVEKNRVPTENITLLLNDQASLKNLRSTLGTKLKNAAGLDDMVIIFFAGHGATERDAMSADGDGLEKYLLPWETDPADLYSTAMPMREIAYIFDRIRSDRLIFIADACYSGASGGRTISVTGTRANITDGFLERITGGRGKVIITASAANEVSVEKDELQHGVFTYYLLEGLRGAADTDRDGTVTVDEAYRYVSEKVPRATGQEQHPVKKGSVEGSLVLSITP